MRHLQQVQRAKKVVSDSPGLVDFATRIVISIGHSRKYHNIP